MFTGIIQALGHIDKIKINESGCRLEVNLQTLIGQPVNVGDSIAVNGVCLTAIKNDQGRVWFDVSLESLSKTCIEDWKIGDEVNLEAALTLQTPLGGHIVTGHVDGIGVCLDRQDAGDSIKMLFQVPAGLGRYIAQKGSVCIDGVSLTTNQLLEDSEHGTTFSVMLVPHTMSVTSLKRLGAGSRVHIEIDVIARYLERMQAYDNKNS